MSYTVRVEQQVKDYLAILGMEHRRATKQALGRLINEQGEIKALGEELDGFHRLRVGPYRVIFRYRPGKVIECVYMNRRALVYEVFEREMLDKLRGGGG
jgi:mRNA-degrading endonuclease RelE of RelBE toxin-antitoxin system